MKEPTDGPTMAAAQQGRDVGIDRAMRAANEEYKAAWRMAVRVVAVQQREFILDEVHDTMRRGWPGVSTHEHRVCGGLMRNAVAEGVCERTGQFRPGRRRAGHATDMPIYRSLIYRDVDAT